MDSRQFKKKFLITSGIILIGLVIVVLLIKNAFSFQNNKNNQLIKTSPTPPTFNYQEELDNCPYDEQSIINFFDTNYFFRSEKEKELAKWKQIPRDFIVDLWKKGYHWLDILQLWGWNLLQRDIPDLKAKERIGVINGLAVTANPEYKGEKSKGIEKEIGVVGNLVVIVRKIPSGGPVINLDKKISADVPLIRGSGNKKRKYAEKIINLAISQEKKLEQHEISLLECIGVESFRNESVEIFGKVGKSCGSSFYLAVLSALTRKPISAQVATTGAIAGGPKTGKINGQEVKLERGTNLPIGGLKEKTSACVKKGITRLVLSKYNSSPNLLSEPRRRNPFYKEEKWIIAEDYQGVVPAEIKEKMTIYLTKNIKELRELILENKLS